MFFKYRLSCFFLYANNFFSLKNDYLSHVLKMILFWLITKLFTKQCQVFCFMHFLNTQTQNIT